MAKSHYPARTVLERVFEQARQRPGAIAMRRCDQTSVIRYGELVAEVDRFAAALRERSVSQGCRVLVVSDNGPETYLSVLACAKLGAIAVMSDGYLPSATIERFCEITAPSAILIAPGSRVSLPQTLASIPAITVDMAVGMDDTDVSVQADWLAGTPALGPDDPLAMVFTSGTTGEPKAVLLANRTFFAIPDILRDEGLDWITWVVGETTYSPLPATHIGGLWWILTCLSHGMLCITGAENTTSLLEILNTNAVTTTCLVPFLISKLVSELKSGDTTVQSLRELGYGGSRAIAADLRFIEAAGIHTVQVYGLSETGCTAMCLPTEDGSISKIEEGAVGRPYPGVDVYLAGPDGHGPAAAGAPPSASFGTLWIKSPANMLGYWNNPERTREVLVDGWVNTGDLLERREDGFFYIKGRSSELIISGGVNVVPDEVDRIAQSVTGVREAACYEILDDVFGALVGLAVVPDTAIDESGARKLKQTIAARYRRESESMARPSEIVLVADIPRTQSGKVMRTSLAATINGDDAAVMVGG
ncbi:fatty acid--CoA ligase FadD10 [Mycobacterium montefiorense]|uniref:Acyl-CoA synthetase n=1 Tax=Mycobacterium montefiorense TaxID=154654 RepID=A0AA37PRN1_9MYCO|nr:fatty acid--CoA ligase FadD10 [Mycobacterium montefiorense]GBG36734.1 putative fatty-acid--CoA ligase FadD10 [Mycobacterium montefiorense]GKU37494.1 acyl-CoA synthetase [Mycobacterium montefiorense]GKU42638.1 acyl-CoA synthetase [Mycobacterium montefiorense]GKU48684.1 acyl-CoA synthetase [Mycobacterium montefiorense]GKU50709.1 acyl-CoA synthetase [Mycobacterium montefiorense]